MARTGAIIGKGTKFGYRDIGDVGAYTYFAEAKVSNIAKVNVGTVEATHYLSDDDTIEKVSGIWRDSEPVNLVMNYLDSSAEIEFPLIGVEQEFIHELPNGAAVTFIGMISSYGGGDVPNKELITQPVTVTPLGPVLYVAAGS